MNSEQVEPSHPVDRSSFFGLPDSIHLLSRMGPTFWGGMLFGLGLGLFVAKFLQELAQLPQQLALGVGKDWICDFFSHTISLVRILVGNRKPSMSSRIF